LVLDTSEKALVSNNLGGVGPKFKDPKEMRFRAAKGIDLRITVRGKDYKATDQTKHPEGSININGARGDFGTINIWNTREKGYFTHKFRFDFVKTGTNKPVKIPSVMFTFFDLDHRDKNGEMISSCDADNAVRSEPTDLKVSTEKGCRVFGSTKKGIPNVEHFDEMTTEQKKSSVVMEFHDKSGFDLDFKITPSGRNFLFIAHPTFVCEDYPPFAKESR